MRNHRHTGPCRTIRRNVFVTAGFLLATLAASAIPAGASVQGLSGGTVAVVNDQQFVSHDYWFSLSDVTFVGEWHITGHTYSFEATSPNITLVSSDLATGGVEAFALSGVGSAGSLAVTCPIGPATFVTQGGSPISASFSTSCAASVNDGPTHTLTLAAEVALYPEFFGPGSQGPTGGTFST